MSTENQVKPATPVTAVKTQITVELLKQLMLGGMNRKAIATHLGAPVSTINKFFKHPELANLRPKHASEFELVDSTGTSYSPGYLANAAKEAKALETEEVVEEEVAEETATETQDGTVATVKESTGI
jgi:hypothetical protein